MGMRRLMRKRNAQDGEVTRADLITATRFTCAGKIAAPAPFTYPIQGSSTSRLAGSDPVIGPRAGNNTLWGKEMKMNVTLSHASNPDIETGYWDAPIDSGKQQSVYVGSLPEAAEVCLAYIERNGLGGGNWVGGDVFNDGVQVARISFNGRVCGMNGAEVK